MSHLNQASINKDVGTNISPQKDTWESSGKMFIPVQEYIYVNEYQTNTFLLRLPPVPHHQSNTSPSLPLKPTANAPPIDIQTIPLPPTIFIHIPNPDPIPQLAYRATSRSLSAFEGNGTDGGKAVHVLSRRCFH